MRHIVALAIKFGLTTLALFIILGGLYDVSFTDVFLVSVLLTGLGYVGDVSILPRVGNTLATLGDFALALIVVWGIGAYRFDADVPLLSASLLSAGLIALGEWFFHKYLGRTGEIAR